LCFLGLSRNPDYSGVDWVQIVKKKKKKKSKQNVYRADPYVETAASNKPRIAQYTILQRTSKIDLMSQSFSLAAMAV
jgi:hypothetical protein